jgi:hypothetical protein
MTTMAATAGRPLPIAAGMCLPDFREEVPVGDVVALAARLADVDPSTATSVDLLARAVGWDQVVAMAQAAQARVLGELTARREVGAHRLVDELQAALSCTTYQAQRMVLRTEALAAHPRLARGLVRGDLDLRRVDAVLDALPVGGDPHRWDGLIETLIENAPLWSPPMLRRQAERLVIAAEPAQAEARCARARADRGLELRPVGDGMALLTALLPAPAAVTVFTVVDALAGTARGVGDERDVHQRRADAFTGIFDAIAATGTLPDGSAVPRKHRRRAEIQVTVAATTLLGLDELPGDLAGFGPIPPGMAREIARDGTWRRLLTDPATGTLVERGTVTYQPGADLTAFVIARDVTCTFMGCGQPGWRCELDHREPFDAGRPADGQTTAANLDVRCKHHHEQKTSGGWSVRRIDGSGACEWTDPWGITFTRLAIPITLTAAALARIRGDGPGNPPWGCGAGTDPPGSQGSTGYPDEPPF